MIDWDQLEEEDAHELHAARRPSCEHAQGVICRCSCGGRFHRHGMPAPARPARAPRTAGPRRHRRRPAQLVLLVV